VAKYCNTLIGGGGGGGRVKEVHTLRKLQFFKLSAGYTEKEKTEPYVKNERTMIGDDEITVYWKRING
jgi:hypothetical protein